MLKRLVHIVNFLNREKVKYNLVDEESQIRIELFLENPHGTKGDYIVITDEGELCMNLFSDLEYKHVETYIKKYNK